MRKESAKQETFSNELPQDLFAKIKAIQIRTQRTVTETMAGQYESAFKGRGMEFEQVREYRSGDDIRHIDWSVTARMNKPYVKEFREERELTVVIMVDVSSSGAFGSVHKMKNEVAAEVAAVLAYTAIKSNDKVGLIIFSDRIERYIPPKKGRAHVWRVVREVLTFRPGRRRTDLTGALDFLGKVIRRRSVVFMISDFQADKYQETLRMAGKRHDLTAVHVVDPREIDLPPVGLIELEDTETGEIVMIDTHDRNTIRGFHLLADQDSTQLAGLLRSSEAGQITIRTDRSTVDPVVRFFRSRERRIH